MTEIRVGLIGAGYIATWHADALKATPGVTVAAVCATAAGCLSGDRTLNRMPGPGRVRARRWPARRA